MQVTQTQVSQPLSQVKIQSHPVSSSAHSTPATGTKSFASVLDQNAAETDGLGVQTASTGASAAQAAAPTGAAKAEGLEAAEGSAAAMRARVREALAASVGESQAKNWSILLDTMAQNPSARMSELLMHQALSAQSYTEPSQNREGINPALMNLPTVAPVKGQALYPVPEGTPSAWVAPEWSADAVSSRIMQLAAYFMAVLPGDAQENLDKVKKAMEEGFLKANDAIGPVPADLAQLFNDTYKATMQKWDTFASKITGKSSDPSTEISDTITEQLSGQKSSVVASTEDLRAKVLGLGV